VGLFVDAADSGTRSKHALGDLFLTTVATSFYVTSVKDL